MGQGAFIYNSLFANLAPPWLLSRIVDIRCPAMHKVARTRFRRSNPEGQRTNKDRTSHRGGTDSQRIHQSMHCWQELVQIAKVVFAELACSIAQAF